MSDKLENYKKKLLYRASYRGTKEMDILLSNFVKKYINELLLEQIFLFLDLNVSFDYFVPGISSKIFFIFINP